MESRRSRLIHVRCTYVIYAVLLGAISPTILHGERLVKAIPLSAALFALACAGCFLGAYNPESRYLWMVSGWFTAAAVAWRIVVVISVTIRDGDLYGREPWFLLTPIAGWLLVLLGVRAVWTHELRPGRDDGG